MRKMKMLRKSILALVLSLCMVVSPLYTSGVSIVNAEGSNLYTQDFESVTDVTTVASSANTPESLTISSGDATYGSYFSFANTAKINGKRGGRLEFSGVDVSAQNSYVMEFDASIKSGSKGETAIAVMGTDFAYATSSNMNSGAGSGYLLNLKSGGASSTAFTINGGSTVTLDGDTWYHYKLYVDKSKTQVSVTITEQNGTAILDKYITDYNGSGNVAGLYLMLGHEYNAKIFADNIVVREVTGEDVFGNAVEATGVTLDQTAITVTEGKTATLTATVAPDTTTDKTVTWSSDAENIATVDDGVVTAVAAGTATITATTVNGKTATCVVTVEAAVVETGPVYLDENFDGYEVGEIIRSGTSEVTPKEIGKLIYKAGVRNGSAGNNYINAVENTAGGKYLQISEQKWTSSKRGVYIEFDFGRDLPTVAELKESGELLELSMDVTTKLVVTIDGFGRDGFEVVPAGTDGHARMIIDGANSKRYCIVTDADGKLLESLSADLTDGATFTGITFCQDGTDATVDNLKVETKAVDLGVATITVKCDGTALADADVTIGGKTVKTDENGQVVMVLPNGTHSVTASKAGYEFTEGGEDNATGSIVMNSAAESLELNLRMMAYDAQPSTVTITDGQTYIVAPAEAETSSSKAFSLDVVDQMGAAMEAADYTVEWSIVKASTGEADTNVTISDSGVVTVAKAFTATDLAEEYIITAKVSANNAEKECQYTLLIVDSDVDYANPLNAESEVIPNVQQGSSLDQYAPTGSMNLSYKTDGDGNGYMQADANGSGNRGSRLDLESGIIKGAEVSFDWRSDSKNEFGYGEILFVAPDTWHPYLTLRFNDDHEIIAFTENRLGDASSTQPDASYQTISVDNAIKTGMSGTGKWFNVKVEFDYLNHTAVLTVVDKENPTNEFTSEAISIEAGAAGIRTIVLHSQREIKDDNSVKAVVTMGVDNLLISYNEYDEGDITSVVNPEDVYVNKVDYDDFVFPTTVTVMTGDGSSKEIPIGEWSSSPVFDKEAEGVYTWTAELVPGTLTNYRGLNATFKMTYTLLPYPFYVHNPNTVELEFGEAMPSEFPTEVVAFMSDGSTSTMKVGEWTAIREFNPDVEGIYVYGANLVATPGKDQIVREQLNRNENHDDHGSDRDAYVYDVYYRISNFKSNDNYNAYTRSMEYLDRGVYAVAADDGIFVSWRLLVTEYGEDVSFNIYRNGELVNAQPITSKTNYVDVNGKAGDSYTVVKLQDGLQYESEAFVAIDKEYMSIPMQKPAAMPSVTGEMAEYTLNDAGVADVDGDGQYEVIVKWYPTNSFDSGKAVKPSSPTIFDVYEMDGTALWRLNLGLEMPSGAHFNQFMFYDLDEDGKAELFIKTSDGSVTYKPNAEGKFDMTDESTIVSYIGDKNVVPGTNVNSNGHMSAATNEYVTVFNGMTGEEIDTIDYINTTGLYTDWSIDGKDDGGNRSARYNIAIAYLPEEAGSTETIPAVLFNRGYYAKTTVAAYTLRDGKLELEWNFAVDSSSVYAEKGNHNMSTGDMDNDGFDELVIGAMAIDHDGTVLWAKDAEEGRDFSGHADAIHLAAMMPDSNQLYVVVPSENKTSTLNYSVTNAATGVRIAGQFMTKADIGRGMAANITPDAGFEYWANVPNSEIANQAPSGAIYNIYGGVISQEKPVNFTTNWRLFWDGDLLSELPDSYNPSVGEGAMSVFKYNWENNSMDTLTTFTGTKLNNSTKNNPSLTADLFGDWREEVMLRSEDSTELRIYLTSEETDYMIYTLMHDPVYRNCVANQNTAYNQPPQLGFYLGEDIKDTVLAMGLPTSKIAYTVEEPEGTEPTATPAPTAAPEVTPAPTAAPEVTPAPTAAPVATPAPTKAPSGGSSSSGSSAPSVSVDWNQVSIDLSTQEDRQGANSNMNVTVGSSIVVPAKTLAALVNEKVTLALHTGNGVTFSLSSKDVTNAALAGSMNLSVAPGNIRVPVAQLESRLEGTLANTQISMVSDESFGMVVNLHVSLGAQHAGKYANLYGYNEETGRLEYKGSFRITENGQAMFAITKGSEYLVTVTNAMPREVVVGDGYIVKAGDTLSHIAGRYRIPLSRLVEMNPDIKNIHKIYVGQSIRIQ